MFPIVQLFYLHADAILLVVLCVERLWHTPQFCGTQPGPGIHPSYPMPETARENKYTCADRNADFGHTIPLVPNGQYGKKKRRNVGVNE